jgi:hypothetical protein
VSAAVSYTSNFNISVLPTNLATAGVQVKWEPFDWGRRGRELAVKSRTVEQAQIAVRDGEERAIVAAAPRPGDGAHLRSASPGGREHPPVHGQPLRSGGARGGGVAHWLLGMALSIPITLAMTFGMNAFGIDLQQISIASLIIALGLLVDDPVVAGDAIKRDLAAGHPPVVAAWWGPTKLAKATLYATITNIVDYLPFLFLPGDSGKFLYSLPVVIGSSLVASRAVSMTFIPLLGYYLLRPKAEPSLEERRKSGFAALYYRLGAFSIRHRWAFLAASLLVLASGGFFMSQLKTTFFPQDLQYLSYVDVWLPEDAPAAATNQVALQVETTVRRVAEEYSKAHAGRSAASTRSRSRGSKTCRW